MSPSNAEYQRRYRNAVPDYADRSRAYSRARGRTLRLLAECYPETYARLLDNELAKEGYAWSGKGGPGIAKTARNLGVPRRNEVAS